MPIDVDFGRPKWSSFTRSSLSSLSFFMLNEKQNYEPGAEVAFAQTNDVAGRLIAAV